MTEEYAWDICGGCGYTVRCKTCNMNMCGGYGELPDGTDCPDCPKAMQWWKDHMDECIALNRRDRAKLDQICADARQRFIDSGGQFSSLEDLKDI